MASVAALTAAGIASQVKTGEKMMEDLEELFGDLDTANDGKLTKREFTAGISAQGLGLSPADIKRIYAILKKKDALGDSTSFVAAAVASSGYSASGKMGSSHIVEIYVPSTANINTVIDEAELRQRVDAAAVVLTNFFGGASASSATIGYYKTDAGEYVKETTHRVYSHTTLSMLQDKSEEVLTFAQDMAQEWTQECIAVVIDGVMHFVYPKNSPDAAELSDTQLLNTFFSRVKRYADIDSISARVKKREFRSPNAK